MPTKKPTTNNNAKKSRKPKPARTRSKEQPPGESKIPHARPRAHTKGFGGLVRKSREALALPQHTFAKQCGFTGQVSVSAMECGTYTPDLVRLAKVLPREAILDLARELLAQAAPGAQVVEATTSRGFDPDLTAPAPVGRPSEVVAPIVIEDNIRPILSTVNVIGPDGQITPALTPIDPDMARQWRQQWRCVIADGYNMAASLVEKQFGWSDKAVAAAFGCDPETSRNTWHTHGPLYLTMGLCSNMGLVGVLDPQGGFYFVDRRSLAGARRIVDAASAGLTEARAK